MFNIFVVRGVKDSMSGYFMFKKNIYTKNKKKLFGKGFKILVDLLVSSSKELKIYSLKIIFKERKNAKSKLNFKILFLIIRFAFQHLIFFRKVTKQK